MIGIYCRTSREKKNLSIEQQQKLGVKFALSHNLEHQIYIDEGKSGYKIDEDDDMNPFSNRPSFTSLINDIKSYKITKVWVYEHSRLSRNQYASAVIFNIFEKHNIELFENNKLIDLKDPQFQFMRQVMDAVSQLERNLIVNRTTRGLHNAINRGGRGFPKLYGYKKIGKSSNGKIIWEPFDKEIDDLKYIFKLFFDGKSLRYICHNMYEIERFDRHTLLNYSKKIATYLSNYIYTGFALNLEGLEVLHKYNELEIDDISVLHDRKYWVKSIPYPIEIITIEEWIKGMERLHVNKIIKKDRLEKSRSASKNLVTGLITCSVCEAKYFSYSGFYESKKSKKKSDSNYYNYYKHHVAINDKICSHKPKSMKVHKIDEIFKYFFFFYYIVFNESNSFVQETLEKIRREIQTTENKVKSEDKNILKIKKQLSTLNGLLSDVDDKDTLVITSKKIAALDNELTEQISNNASSRVDLEKLYKKYSNTELENTYINIKERILSFFNDMSIERQRNELIRIIKKCLIFNHYLLIDTGKIVFLFDITKEFVFESSLLENLNRDEIYKKYFINGEMETNIKKVKYKEKDFALVDLDLTRDIKVLRKTQRYLKNKLAIDFDLKEKTNLVSFTLSRAFWSIERWDLTDSKLDYLEE